MHARLNFFFCCSMLSGISYASVFLFNKHFIFMLWNWKFLGHFFLTVLIDALNFFLQVVTCGNVPLESSFQKIPRCVYTSTSLYEYRGWGSEAANSTHRRFTWGLRSLEVSTENRLLFSRMNWTQLWKAYFIFLNWLQSN